MKLNFTISFGEVLVEISYSCSWKLVLNNFLKIKQNPKSLLCCDGVSRKEEGTKAACYKYETEPSL